MNDYLPNDFLSLAELHAETIKNVERLSHSAGDNKSNRDLAHAIEEQRGTREAIVRWQPSSRIVAQIKLLYLVSFLASTKTSLNPIEMTAVFDSIGHLRN